MTSESVEFERLNKPRAIEEPLDTFVWRRLGYLLVQRVRHTSVTPNLLSGASVMAALACAWAYAHPGLPGALGGLAFMVAHSVFDAADGQLARVPGRASRHGHAIDGFADTISFTAIYLGILTSYLRGPSAHLGIGLALGIAAGLSHQVQCAMVEQVRQLYWYFSGGCTTLRHEKPECVRAQRDQAAGVERLILQTQLTYSLETRWLRPSSDRLQRCFEALQDSAPGRAERLAADYRRASAALLPAWSWLAPNSHKIGIVACAFVPVGVSSGWAGELGHATFFLYDLALNLPLLFVVLAQSRVDRRLLVDVDAPRA